MINKIWAVQGRGGRLSASVEMVGSVGYGVTANIAASHAAARGSIPRTRVLFIAHVSPFE